MDEVSVYGADYSRSYQATAIFWDTKTINALRGKLHQFWRSLLPRRGAPSAVPEFQRSRRAVITKLLSVRRQNLPHGQIQAPTASPDARCGVVFQNLLGAHHLACFHPARKHSLKRHGAVIAAVRVPPSANGVPVHGDLHFARRLHV